VIQHRRHVNVEMGVHSTGHRARSIYDCQRRPFLSSWFGMAPPPSAARWIVLLAQGDPPHQTERPPPQITAVNNLPEPPSEPRQADRNPQPASGWWMLDQP
jgi:hypothetical protein